MPNTTYGTPYVSSSDYVSNWPTVSQSVANAIDTNAFGIIALANKTSAQGSIGSTEVDISSLSVTWTAYSARSYRITMYLGYLSLASAAGYIQAKITDSSNTQKQFGTQTIDAGRDTQIVVMSIESGLSGSVTRKGRISAQGGSLTVQGDSTRPAYIMVEDLGIL